jgi:hypothetical protein
MWDGRTNFRGDVVVYGCTFPLPNEIDMFSPRGSQDILTVSDLTYGPLELRFWKSLKVDFRSLRRVIPLYLQ